MADYSFNLSLLSNGNGDQSSSLDSSEPLSPGIDISTLETSESWPRDSSDRCRVIRLTEAHSIYGCCECEETFLSPLILESHLRDCHPWLRSACVCPTCGRRFLHSGHVLRHRRETHEPAVREHRCELCDKRFKRAEHLRGHERASHARARDFACTICGRAFARRENARRHERLVHRQDLSLVCDGCGKVFARPAGLTRHRRACVQRPAPVWTRVQEQAQVDGLLLDPTMVAMNYEDDDWIKLLVA